METVDVREVRLSLSRLLQRVKRGEEIVITEGKEPVARLVPYRPASRPPLPSRAALRAEFEGRGIEATKALFEERDER